VKEPVLVTFNPEKPIIMETDSSNKAIGALISQPDKKEKMYPVAFYLRKLNFIELNYNIYNKKLLAIIVVFQE